MPCSTRTFFPRAKRCPVQLVLFSQGLKMPCSTRTWSKTPPTFSSACSSSSSQYGSRLLCYRHDYSHDYSHEQVWIFTGSLTVTLASVSAIGAALALAYFTCEQHHDDYVIGDDNNVTQYHLVMIIMSMSLADDNNVTQCHSMSLCRHFRPQPAILPLHECPRGCDCSWCVSEEYLLDNLTDIFFWLWEYPVLLRKILLVPRIPRLENIDIKLFWKYPVLKILIFVLFWKYPVSEISFVCNLWLFRSWCWWHFHPLPGLDPEAKGTFWFI